MVCSTDKFNVPLSPYDHIDYLYDWSDFLTNEEAATDEEIDSFLLVLPQEAIDAGLLKDNETIIDIVKTVDGVEVTYPNAGVKVWFQINASDQDNAAWKAPGLQYAIRCKITTTSGRVKNKSPKLRVKRD